MKIPGKSFLLGLLGALLFLPLLRFLDLVFPKQLRGKYRGFLLRLIIGISNPTVGPFALKIMRTNLSEAKLSGANLTGVDLRGFDLINADLAKANLMNSNLMGANFSNTDLSKANLLFANLVQANLSGANLMGADLKGANLSHANLNDAKLVGSFVYGTSAWNVDLEKTTQLNLIITRPDEPPITVDNLEVAQFIYLLLNHKKLRDVLNSVMERGVLLLGRFSEGGLDLLLAIAAKLREMKYLPIIFDFDRPQSRNLTETVLTLVGLSRFVIVDLSGPSVANELRATVPHFKIPFVPIIEESRIKEVYSMFSDLSEDEWVLPLVRFTSRENLMELLPALVIEPAERKCEERQFRLKQILNR